jgi:hypothetical protein
MMNIKVISCKKSEIKKPMNVKVFSQNFFSFGKEKNEEIVMMYDLDLWKHIEN